MRIEGDGEEIVEKCSVVSTPVAATSSPGGGQGDPAGSLFEQIRRVSSTIWQLSSLLAVDASQSHAHETYR
jgi:hypothetical protein